MRTMPHALVVAHDGGCAEVHIDGGPGPERMSVPRRVFRLMVGVGKE